MTDLWSTAMPNNFNLDSVAKYLTYSTKQISKPWILDGSMQIRSPLFVLSNSRSAKNFLVFSN